MLKKITAALTYLFAAVVLAFTIWRTYSLLSLTSPDSIILPALGLFVFDIGFLSWTMIFLHRASGVSQRVVALTGAVADLILVIVAVIADLFLHGQTLTAVPEWMGLAALITISLAVAINMVLLFLYHVFDPTMLADLRTKMRDDEIADALNNEQGEQFKLALGKLKDKRREIADQVADGQADEMVQQLLEQMNATQYVTRQTRRPAANGTAPAPKGKAPATNPEN